MKNFVSKLFLVIFVVQIFAQMVLMSGASANISLFNFLDPNNNNNKNSNSNAKLDPSSNVIAKTSSPSSNSPVIKTIQTSSSNSQPVINPTNPDSRFGSSSVGSLTATSSVVYKWAGGATGQTLYSFDIGSAGNNRMVAVFASVEGGLSSNLAGVTVDGKAATLVTKAENIAGAGSHLELWVITESGLGQSNGPVTIQLGSGSTTSWGVHAMLFYGVLDSTTAYDAEMDISTTSGTEIKPGTLDIPDNGLVIFSAAQGLTGNFNAWDTNPTSVTDDGQTNIFMNEAYDPYPNNVPNSATLAEAYYVNTLGNQYNRQFRANSDTDFSGYRASGIIASFFPANRAKTYTMTLNLNGESSFSRNLLTNPSSTVPHYPLLTDTVLSTYVHEDNSAETSDLYYLSSNPTSIGQIQRVVVYAIGQSRAGLTNSLGTIDPRLGASGYSYISGSTGKITSYSNSNPNWDLYSNAFYSSYKGGSWSWGDISSMNVRLYLFNFQVAKLWIEIEYKDVQAPSVSNYGVDDKGTGQGVYWAQFNDDFDGNNIMSATMNINGVDHSLSNNGTYWTYTASGISYDSTSTYYVSSAIDSSLNQYTNSGTTYKTYTFTNDFVNPTVNTANYYANSTVVGTTAFNGTFKINATDYGVIQTVMVNVTTISGKTAYLTYNSSSGLYETNEIFLTNGSFSFTVTVTDVAGNKLTTSTYEGSQTNYLPEARNLYFTPTLPNTTDTIQLNYTYFDYDNQAEAGTEIFWYINNGLQSQYNNSLTLPSSLFIKGDNIAALIKPHDSIQFGNPYWKNVTIGDSKPQILSVSISPLTNTTTIQQLQAVYNPSSSFYDADGDALTVYIEWYVNGGHYGALDNQDTVNSSYTQKGDTWYYRIRVSDGTQFSDWVNSSTVMILNSAPTLDAYAITPSIAYTSNDLNATISSHDVDGDVVTVYVKWYKGNQPQSGLDNSIVVNSSLTLKGELWFFSVQLSDGNLSTNWVNSSSILIQNSVPTVSNITISPDIVYSNGTLTLNYNFTDADNDQPGTPIIVWYRNNTLIGALNGSKTVDFSYLIRNTSWMVAVKVIDSGTIYSSWGYSNNITIGNTPTVVDQYYISRSSLYTDSNLVAYFTTHDNDSDPYNFNNVNLTWYLYGSPYASNVTTIDSSVTSKGQTWYFTIQVYDGYNYSILYTSQPITILNAPPTATYVYVNNGNSTQINGTALYANFTYNDIDNDPNVSTTIHWYVSGIEDPSLMNSFYIGGGNVTDGQFWFYTVQVYDGNTSSTVVYSNSVYIGSTPNSKPVVTSISISYESGNYTSSNILLNYTYYDFNGDNQSGTIIQWYRNGVLYSTGSSLVIYANATYKNDQWYAVVTPRDGYDYGASNTSNILIVGNSLPTVSNIQITTISGNNKTNDDLYLSYTWDDPDKPIDSEQGTLIQWYVGGVYDPTFDNSKNISSIYTQKGQTWAVNISVGDGENNSIWVFMTYNFTVLNSAPTASNVKITPGTAYTTDNLTASYIFSDLDSVDTNQSIIYWYKNGILQTGLTNKSVVYYGYTNKTDNWYFILIPYDGYDKGANYTSANYIIIQNTAPTISNIEFNNQTNPIVYSNGTITLTYTFSDNDTSDGESGTIITWYMDNVSQTQLQNQKFVPNSYLKKGHYWNVTITPKDGTKFGSTYISISFVIRNTPSIITSSSIGPSNPKTTDTISISYSYTDQDGDSPQNVTIYWYMNNSLQPTLNNSLYVYPSSTIKDQSWFAVISIFDGTNESKSYTTNTIVILNSAPKLTSIVVNPLNANTSSDLTISIAYSDADGDNVSAYQIKWYKNGILQSQFTDMQSIYHGYTNRSESWYYTIIVTDNTSQSSLYTSNIVTIQNSLPSITQYNYVSENVLSNGSISIIIVFYDADNDFNNSIIHWYRDNTLVPELNGKTTVDSSYLQFNESWYVTVTPNDGISSGQMKTFPIIVIKNTPPTTTNQLLNNNVDNTGTSSEIVLSYSFSDNDAQSENKTLVHVIWFVTINNVTNPVYALNDSIYVPSNYTAKNQIWFAKFQVYDGYNYSIWYQTLNNVTIINTAPIITYITLTNSTSTQEITITYGYYDVDNDSEGAPVIIWYFSGIPQTQYNGLKTIPANATSLGDYWSVQVIPYDGFDYGQPLTNGTTVQDSAPSASGVVITSNNPTYMSNSTLSIQYNYSDYDQTHFRFVPQNPQTPRILWYKNSSGSFILMGSFNDSLTIPSSELHRGDQWYVVIYPFDGVLYGNASFSIVITIVNTPPSITNVLYMNGRYPQFYVENENISLSYVFSDKDLDANQTIIYWYKDNKTLISNLDNKDLVPSNYTTYGEIWRVEIIPYDGYQQGTKIVLYIMIESLPQVNQVTIQNITDSSGYPSEEGQYTVIVNATDSLHSISQTTITITITKDNIKSNPYVLLYTNGTDNIYTQDIDLMNLLSRAGYPNSEYKNLVGSTLTIEITLETKVTYGSIITITNTLVFNIPIQDNAPPRVTSASYDWNNPTSPTNITFYANVVDYGSDIQNVTLYYYFRNSSTSQTTALTGNAKINADYPYIAIQMERINATTYAKTILFSPTVATDVLFDIGVIDSSGNSNQGAYPLGTADSTIRAGRFTPAEVGLSPELVAGIIGVVLIIALLFTFVGIKKFRSTELVGLDKELVVSKIKDIKHDSEIETQMDLHTLGIIVSFFDQRHGPIPIIVTPEILQDNYNLLVDLSDMSFSSARFSGNFEDEIFSTYNFNPAPGQFINIISFGYALDRPSARGGAENITLNILIHKNVSDLISQFIDKFQSNIHEIHVLMDKQPDEKDLITKKIKELRLFLSKIVISYEKLYGTTELLDSYDQIFDS